MYIGYLPTLLHIITCTCTCIHRERDLFLPEIGLQQQQNRVESGADYSRSVSQPWVFLEDIEEVTNVQVVYMHVHVHVRVVHIHFVILYCTMYAVPV